MNRLYRIRKEAMLGGVCAGLAEYLNIDVTIVRIFFLLFTLTGGMGVGIYLLLWILLPVKDEPDSQADFGDRARRMGEEFGEAMRRSDANRSRLVGIALLLVGVYFLLQSLNIPWLHFLRGEVVWAGLLIVAGVALLTRSLRGS